MLHVHDDDRQKITTSFLIDALLPPKYVAVLHPYEANGAFTLVREC